MLGRQVQTKEADVDHEIGEETGARKSHISQYEKYEIGEENLIFIMNCCKRSLQKTGNFDTQQAFLNLVRMMEMILNQQES